MKLTSRLYENEIDLRHMQELLIEGRSQTDDWHYIHIGEFTFKFFMIACHLNPQEQIRLWHHNDKLVGFAMVGEDPSLDWHVLPEYEWRGIETEAMAWAKSVLPQQRGSLVSGARQDNGKRRVFLKQNGFRYSGEFAEVNMMRRLTETLPGPALSDRFQIRSIGDKDEISKRVAAYREVWQPWTDGDVSAEQYDCFMRLPAYQRDLDIVAITDDGSVAAFANGWIDPVNQIGEIGSVGVIPAYRRHGLMSATLLECIRLMQSKGMERVSVSTGVQNIPAIRLYQSVGFETVNQYLDYEFTDYKQK